jgi:hypothetical protein
MAMEKPMGRDVLRTERMEVRSKDGRQKPKRRKTEVVRSTSWTAVATRYATGTQITASELCTFQITKDT